MHVGKRVEVQTHAGLGELLITALDGLNLIAELLEVAHA